MRLKHLHLIGGAPLTGKTTLGTELATTSGSVLMSTDNILYNAWIKGQVAQHGFQITPVSEQSAGEVQSPEVKS
jgi:adenylate kinase family enzyme